jgi:hypothetical protein
VAVRRILEFLAGNAFIAVIICAIAGTFFVLYSAVVWLDLPDIPHGILGGIALVISVAAGAGVGMAGNRMLNPRPPSPNRVPSRR